MSYLCFWVREYKNILKLCVLIGRTSASHFFMLSVRRIVIIIFRRRHPTKKAGCAQHAAVCCRVAPAWGTQQRWSEKLNGTMNDKRAA
jgi:hypothetical protein